MSATAASAELERASRAIDYFVGEFQPSYRLLAQHMALPLVLTPELVNFIRNRFLRAEGVPWVAEVDLLLSDLCRPAGFELYMMSSAVRSRLLGQLEQDERFGRQRLEAIARSLMTYNHYLSRTNGLSAPLLQAQQWAAMVYLQPQREAAVGEIAAEFARHGAAAPEIGPFPPIQPAELARLAQIVQELAPELQEYRDLLEYARLITQVGAQPQAIPVEDWQKTYQVLDTELHLPAELLPGGVGIEASWLQGLQPFEFETGTVEFVETLEEPAENDGVVLESFEFETAQISRGAAGGWDIERRRGSAQQFVEKLGDGTGLAMVFVPGGKFMMGSPDDEPGNNDDEKPQHEVEVSPFYLGKYPVTQAQWRAVAALPQVERALKPEPSHFKGANRPVERVSWHDAVEFCRRLSRHSGRDYRLPSEAEWEYACRAGTTTPFYFGDALSSELANYNGNATYGEGPEGEYREETKDVGSFPANGFGFYDMHGNVWEWCADDWHDNYDGAPNDGSAWVDENPTKIKRVLRGGAWYVNPKNCRSAIRVDFSPVSAIDVIGFRVVCAASIA
ncbi:formylglycine-generating enzyme family protein [Phormidium yuhuli AB48]|uniref:Formylglycine-generating enzyme family protein n=1 Tax=Phormidium yuhuli AB48 TaxID=2940671 RepID=A0ABY5AUK6_9CYAN|nr:formylglycine-generating enzyme family protein [Phormidium yuhuli]USR92720.1 formylglycine-generating enzyme family protein [Phormidium yuhuli AB48]